MKLEGGGSALLERATEIAKETGGYFVHPHLDPLWTDGYRGIAAEIVEQLPDCRSLVFPVGGGGLLLGLLTYLKDHPSPVRLYGCEPYNYPKYAQFNHARTTSIADLVRNIKSNSSSWVHDTFPDRSSFAWQSGYGVLTVSQNGFERAVAYVRQQRERHAAREVYGALERIEGNPVDSR